MIIRRLRGENLFRFDRLDLDDWPEHGLIGISGPNESGKSATLEALSLALFGRTTAHLPPHTGKVVQWGAASATVELVFTARDGQSYSVARHVEREGRQRARLKLAVADTTITQGPEAVTHAVEEVLGFNFQAWSDALYQAQRRGGEGSAHSATIKALAGVAPLEGVAEAMAREAVEAEQEIADNAAETERIGAEREALALDPEALGALVAERDEGNAQADAIGREITQWHRFQDALAEGAAEIEQAVAATLSLDDEADLERWSGALEELDRALTRLEGVCRGERVEMDQDPAAGLRRWRDGLRERLGRLAALEEQVASYGEYLRAWLHGEGGGDRPTLAEERRELGGELNRWRRMRGRTGAAAILLGGLAMAAGGAAGLLLGSPGSALARQLAPTLAKALGVAPGPAAALLAGLAAVALMVVVVRHRHLGREAEEAGQELAELEQRATRENDTLERLERAMQAPLMPRLAALARLEEAPFAGELAAWLRESGRPLLDPEERTALMTKLEERLARFREQVEAVREEVEDLVAEAQAEQDGLSGEVARLEEEIQRERARRIQDSALGARLRELDAATKAAHQRIRVRQVAEGLLHGAAQPLALRFNRELRRFLSQVGPRFTEGRYRHVKIDDDLTVKAFSVEKDDFIEMAEISTGVQQQLLLSVRLSLAQALVARTRQGSQCLLLDEPFAFFDRQRMRTALEALLGISPQLCQVVVVAQEFEQDQALARHIRCHPERRILTMSG